MRQPVPAGLLATFLVIGCSGAPKEPPKSPVQSPPGETLTFGVSGLITLTSGELLITTNLTITGPGASQLTVQRSTAGGTPDFRIFDIRSGIVTLSGLTVNNGRSDSGGGLLNQARAALTMHDVVFSGNAATNAGGGIKNVGTLTLDRAMISGNSASGAPKIDL